MKRQATGTLTSKEDKKARYEAGLDLDLSRDLSDLQIESILKEVNAPSTIQSQISNWLDQLTSLLSGLQVDKLSRQSINTNQAPFTQLGDLPAKLKYPGLTVTDVIPIGPLAANSLVFPKASGTIHVSVAFNKPAKDFEEQESFIVISLAKVCSILEDSPLLSASCLAYNSWSRLPVIQVTPSNKKLREQLTVRIELFCEFDKLYPEKKGLSKPLLEELNRLMQSHANYRSATQLIEIWVRQLKLLLPVNLFPVVFLHGHLTNQISSAMKPWQLVRRLWTLLADSLLNCHHQQLILGVLKPVPSEARSSPFLDRDGTTPLFAELPLSQWSSLAAWAASALTVSLDSSLLMKHSMGALYDVVLVFEGRRCDPCQLMLNLAYAYGNRVLRLSAICKEVANQLLVGLNLNASNYYHPATHGPESDDVVAAEKFRNFWGERSELRRFQDGTVKEVVVWGTRKQEVIADIARAVAARHHPNVHVVELSSWQHRLLTGDGGDLAKQELDSLTPVLYGLEGLPLAVSSVAGYGEEFRLARVGTRTNGWRYAPKSTEEVSTTKQTGKRTVQLIDLTMQSGQQQIQSVQCLDVMLQAAHSGKWPKDEAAVRRLHVAWLHEVGKALEKKVDGLGQAVIGERLVVVTPSRRVLLRLSVGEKGRDRIGHLAQFASWLGGVAKSNPAWSGGVRLAKRWLAAQMLLADDESGGQVSATAVEVLMASVFLNPGKFGGLTPVSPASAFHRWLQLVARHDWNEEPVMVLPEMAVNVESARSELPPLAVISPYEPSPSYWTSPGPTWPGLQRLIVLAGNALSIVDKQEEDDLKTVKRIFVPSLETYEFLIHLESHQIPNRYLSIEADSKEDELTSKQRCPNIPVIQFNPALCLLRELTQSYSSLASFYYNIYGGTVIAVKVKQVSKGRVKVHELAGHMSRGKETELNWGAIVEDWRTLGAGIVKDVVCQDAKIIL